jgi:hypothetical protein
VLTNRRLAEEPNGFHSGEDSFYKSHKRRSADRFFDSRHSREYDLIIGAQRNGTRGGGTAKRRGLSPLIRVNEPSWRRDRNGGSEKYASPRDGRSGRRRSRFPLADRRRSRSPLADRLDSRKNRSVSPRERSRKKASTPSRVRSPPPESKVSKKNRVLKFDD